MKKATKYLSTPFDIIMFFINAAEEHGMNTVIATTEIECEIKLENEAIKEEFSINCN